MLFIIEKFMFNIEDSVKHIDFLAIKANDNDVRVFIGSSNPEKIKIKDLIIKQSTISKNFKVEVQPMSKVESLIKKLTRSTRVIAWQNFTT